MAVYSAYLSAAVILAASIPAVCRLQLLTNRTAFDNDSVPEQITEKIPLNSSHSRMNEKDQSVHTTEIYSEKHFSPPKWTLTLRETDKVFTKTTTSRTFASGTGENDINTYLESDFSSTSVTSAESPPTHPQNLNTGEKGKEMGKVYNTTEFGHLELTAEMMLDCFLNDGDITAKAAFGEIYIKTPDTSKLPENNNDGYPRFCTLKLEVPSDHILHMRFHEMEITSGEFYLVVTDRSEERNGVELLDAYCNVSKELFLFSNRVDIEFEWSNLQMKTWINFTFQTVDLSYRPTIEVVFVSNTTGYVQSPGWDGVSLHPTGIDSWATLPVPNHHTVMLSFSHLNIFYQCQDSQVALYAGGRTPQNLTSQYCGIWPLRPRLFRDDVHVRFRTDSAKTCNTGFRLMYSIHTQERSLQKVGDAWNCSVSFWGDFQAHFPCNIRADCVGREDEDSCFYTNRSVCGDGQFTVMGHCYAILQAVNRTGWRAASSACAELGGILMSPNTHEEWTSVESMLPLLQEPLYGYIGLSTAKAKLPKMYYNKFRLADGSMAFYLHCTISGEKVDQACIVLETDKSTGKLRYLLRRCTFPRPESISAFCEFPPRADKPVYSVTRKRPVLSNITVPRNLSIAHVTCWEGHVTHSFLSCDPASGCRVRPGEERWCLLKVEESPPSFSCVRGLQSVPFQLVCDHRSDCTDGSDESFCVHSPCSPANSFGCGDGQCVPLDQECDGMSQCVSGADEDHCEETCSNCRKTRKTVRATSPPPALVEMGNRGHLMIESLNGNGSVSCPETHFVCPGAQYSHYCLPVYLRCNHVSDCPHHEDEVSCNSYECPGFYRCRSSKICVHVQHVCDGLFGQCPENDDELLCGFPCPEACTCFGQAFFCKLHVMLTSYVRLRYLQAGGTNMNLTTVTENMMLVHLSLAQCHLKHLEVVRLPNLIHLDLTGNQLYVLSHKVFDNMKNLRVLILAGNPLQSPMDWDKEMINAMSNVQQMDLSYVFVHELDPIIFAPLKNLDYLNLSYSGLDHVFGNGFKILTGLKHLSLTGCPVTIFPRYLFRGLDHLSSVEASNYKLCCPANLPQGFDSLHCVAPFDEISSCESLLRSDLYRIALSILTTCGLVGNVVSVLYRMVIHRHRKASSFGVFVQHLCLADFLMGVYLATIGVADRYYHGSYLWNDVSWRHSYLCQSAGLLSLLSCEVSAFIICFITLDRFLVLRFPFSPLHFTSSSAHLTCMCAWLVGVTLAAVPVSPVTRQWQFYSQTAICIPLPITRNDFPGRHYSFGIIVVFNFILFLVIAVGQVLIYWSIQTNTISSSDTSKRSKDLIVAQRLVTVVLSDFLCWFPVGLLGLLASHGVAVVSEVNVAMAIFVLPLNSALNPFLYSLNLLMHARRCRREQRLKQVFLAQHAAAHAHSHK